MKDEFVKARINLAWAGGFLCGLALASLSLDMHAVAFSLAALSAVCAYLAFSEVPPAAEEQQ